MHQMQTNAADSAEVLNLVVTFMDHLKNGEVVEAVDMLGNSDPDSISDYNGIPLDLPQEVKDLYVRRYSRLDIDHYEIENFQFSDYTCNQVRSKVYFKDGTNSTLNFNPIKAVGAWRLTVRDSYRGDRSFED